MSESEGSASQAVARTTANRPAAGTIRRRANLDKSQVDKPNSTRAAGHGGSSSTMMRLYTADNTPGLRVDPTIIMVLAVVFIFSVVSLHLTHNLIRWWTK